jgi:hypothetical protein
MAWCGIDGELRPIEETDSKLLSLGTPKRAPLGFCERTDDVLQSGGIGVINDVVCSVQRRRRKQDEQGLCRVSKEMEHVQHGADREQNVMHT